MSRTKNDQSTIIPESDIVFYELEKVRFIIKDGSGIDIAYAYEDLVFSEHGIFIFQFDTKKADTIYCWFNLDCEETYRLSLTKSLSKSASLNGMTIIYKGKFEMNQKGHEQIAVNFKEC